MFFPTSCAMKRNLFLEKTKGSDVEHLLRLLARTIVRFFMVLLVALWISPLAYGQVYKYVGLEDGLSSRNVYAVQQSNGGFIWCLTDKGVDRYDGTEISEVEGFVPTTSIARTPKGGGTVYQSVNVLSESFIFAMI